jgi:hypothetical protein
MIFKYLLAMDCFYKSCVETDLTMLHYVMITWNIKIW